MIKRILLSLSILVCLHSWSFAEIAERPVQFFFEGGLHRAAIDGTVLWSDAEVLGTEIDLDGTFGLEDINAFTGRAGILVYRRHELLVNYRRYSLSKDTTLSTSIRYGGTVIPANLPISPSLTFQTIGVYYGFRLIDKESGFLSLRPGVEFVDYEVELSSSFLGFQLASLEYSGDYTVPFFLITGEFKLHPMISLAGEFSGGRLEDQVAYFIQPSLKIGLYPHLFGFVGYSYVWFKDDRDENLFEVTLSGLVAGVQFLW